MLIECLLYMVLLVKGKMVWNWLFVENMGEKFIVCGEGMWWFIVVVMFFV